MHLCASDVISSCFTHLALKSSLLGKSVDGLKFPRRFRLNRLFPSGSTKLMPRFSGRNLQLC